MEVIGQCRGVSGHKQKSRGRKKQQPVSSKRSMEEEHHFEEDNKENCRLLPAAMDKPCVITPQRHLAGRDATVSKKNKMPSEMRSSRRSISSKVSGVQIAGGRRDSAPLEVEPTYSKYIAGCIGKVAHKDLTPLRDSLTVSKNALRETLEYMQARKRNLDQLRSARRFDRNIDETVLVSNPMKVTEQSAELSAANYSRTICEPTLPSRIFSDSVLDKIAKAPSSSLRRSGHRRIAARDNAINACITACANSRNISVENRDNTTTTVLSSTNKASCKDNTLVELNESADKTVDIQSVSVLSEIADLTCYPHEQASSLDLATSDIQLHSTFSYPLHSTMMQMNESAMLDSTMVAPSSGHNQTKSNSSAAQSLKSAKSDESTIGLNNADMKSFGDVTPTSGSERLSVTDVIRSTVKENVKSTVSLAIKEQSVDANNNGSFCMRLPGDGCDEYDSDDSCDSSTLSICVDDESFVGDAGSTQPEGNCDVCKIMKRQKATVDLKCSSDSDNNGGNDTTKMSVLSASKLESFSDLASSPAKRLRRYIQASKSVLRRSDPRHHSPDNWVGSEVAEAHHSKYGHTDETTTHRSRVESLSLDSSDSGRGSSYLSDMISMDTTANHHSNLKIWHSTPFTTVSRLPDVSAFPVYNDSESCVTPKPCKRQKKSIERGLRDSTGRYLNTPGSKSTRSRLERAEKMCVENLDKSDYDTKAIKKKLKRFCKNFQQENGISNLQTLAHV